MRAVMAGMMGVAGLLVVMLALGKSLDGDNVAAAILMGTAVCIWLLALVDHQVNTSVRQ